MSDNNDEVPIMETDEDYDLEYSEDSFSEPDVDLENQYYYSKALKDNEPLKAIESFEKVLELENDNNNGVKGQWGFKALKQMIKLNLKLEKYDEILICYKKLLTYIKSAVTRNYSEKSINAVLDSIAVIKNQEFLLNFYDITLDALKNVHYNYRLWFKTNLKLGKLYIDMRDFKKLVNIIECLYQSCLTDIGDEDDLKKGTQLLEIYSLEIQMYTEQKQYNKLKMLYEKSLKIKSAVPHPLIMGCIRECGGKMHLRENRYNDASTDFFEAFKNYDESGSKRAKICLKYLILANMLMKSTINPFDSQEAKPYKNDQDIFMMVKLWTSYQNDDIKEFQSIVELNKHQMLSDSFIAEYIEILSHNIRIRMLQNLVTSYSRIHLSYIAQTLAMDDNEIENFIVNCILDNIIYGKIDQINQFLVIDKNKKYDKTYSALEQFEDKLNSLNLTINKKLEND